MRYKFFAISRYVLSLTFTEKKKPVKEKDLNRKDHPDSVLQYLHPAYRFPHSVITSTGNGRIGDYIQPDRNIKNHRGQNDYNSMLVHTSHLTKKADYVACKIDKFLTKLANKFSKDNDHYLPLFQKRLDMILDNSKNPLFKEYFGDIEYKTPKKITVKDVREILTNSVSPLDVVSYHSSKSPDLNHHNHSLNYNLKYPRNYIVVGGNRLSRGLTLEGLTTSYFVLLNKWYSSY